MHGARKGHEVHDVSLALALNLEHDTVSQNFLTGISMDRKNFSTFCSMKSVFYLLETLGAPEGILTAGKKYVLKTTVSLQIPKSYNS